MGKLNENRKVAIAFLVLLMIYLIGFGIDIMDVDAAQYASMSREMLERGDWLQMHDLGREYLDKPPFLIWISALSMKIFGVNNFGYRLPSLLFALSSIYSTYKFASLFYDRRTAVLSAFVLASCQGFFLMNHDVRTDTILMSWVIFALWQFAAWFSNKRFIHFILACAGIAGGMMTKGPIALIVPVFAFGAHFLLQRNWKNIFRKEYLLAPIIIGVLLIPVCIGLYQQFDLHPDKIVNGKTGVSGLRFFFWTQSFGRITGESEWNNHRGFFFLLQNMGWSFLPWILMFLTALFISIKNIIVQKFRISTKEEAITTGGFVLTYISLAISKYQLPHYIFVVFPLAAIITAKFISSLTAEAKNIRLLNVLKFSHAVIFSLLWLALIVLLYACFDTIPTFVTVLAIVCFLLFTVIVFRFWKKIWLLPVIAVFTMAGLNLFLNAAFYPALLKYQLGSSSGRFIHEKHIPTDRIFIYKDEDRHSLDFYAQHIIAHKEEASTVKPGDFLLLQSFRLAELDNSHFIYNEIYKNNEYSVSNLSLKFLNPHSRPAKLLPYSIVEIKGLK